MLAAHSAFEVSPVPSQALGGPRNPGALPRRAPDGAAATQHFRPVPHIGQPAHVCGFVKTAPVVLDHQFNLALGDGHGNPDLLGTGVAGGVAQSFGKNGQHMAGNVLPD